jgi:hypothetical protein
LPRSCQWKLGVSTIDWRDVAMVYFASKAKRIRPRPAPAREA